MRQILIAAAFALAAGAAWAAEGRIETELNFAKGLTELGYYDLAEFHLEQLGWRDRPAGDLRDRIVMKRVENFRQAAENALTAVDALQGARSALDALDGYLELDLPEETLHRILEHRGHSLLDLGRRAWTVFQRQPSGVDYEAAADEAARSFEQAESSFAEAIAQYRQTVEDIEAKRDITDDDRKIRADLLPRIVNVETQMGWARYERAQLFQEAGDEDAYRAGLEAAAELFKAQTDARDTLLAGYSASLGYGLCLQELGKHEEALEAFERAILVRAEPHTLQLRFQGMYQKAKSQAELGDLEEAVRTLEAMGREFRRLPSHLEKAWKMRYGRYLAVRGEEVAAEAEGLREQQDELREDRPDNWARLVERLGEQAEARQREARRLYERAMEQVRPVAEARGEYSREATLLLGQWAEAAGIDRRRSASDWFASGERLLAAGEFEEAVQTFQAAVSTAGRRRSDRDVAHDAWIQMGTALARMGSHYEAGLVFGRAARLFPDSEYAESLAGYSAMLLGHAYEQGQTDLEARAYFDAQRFLVEKFPDSESAGRSAFRLGDVQRAQGRHVQAAEYYSQVSRASEFYERAQYLAGWCLWEAATESGADGEPDQALARSAEERLNRFLAWAEGQSAGDPDAQKARAEWVGKSRLLLAAIYHEQGRYEDILAVALAEEALERLAPRPDLAGRGRIVRVRALCAAQEPAAARRAGEEIAAIRESAAIEPSRKSAAAQLVGTTFLTLAEGEEGEAAAALLSEARRYLVEAIDLLPEPSISDYETVASSLYQAEAYDEAAEVFRLLVERHTGSPEHAEAVRDARRWIGVALRDSGAWQEAADEFAGLVADYPEALEARRELALTLENEALQRHTKAERHWRVMEGALPMGGDDWFEARYHRVKNLALDGRTPLALQLLASTRVPYPNLGGAERREKFERIVEERFTEEQQQAYRDLANME